MSFISIGDALFTKTQQKVLGLLYGEPTKRFYTNEIIRLAGMGRGTIRRELDRLLASGLLVVTHEGNQHYYQSNHKSPVYEELVSIVRKTFGIVDVIAEMLQQVDNQIDLSFIYGSVAKGEETTNSDIDLFVVSDSLAYADLMAILTKAEQSLGRPINPSIYTREQIKNKLVEKNSFLTRVLEQPKLWVKGVENDISEFR